MVHGCRGRALSSGRLGLRHLDSRQACRSRCAYRRIAIAFTSTIAFQDDLPTVGALIAPRPFKILSARRDVSFPPAGYHEAYQLTRRFYEMYGAADKLVEFDYEAPHQDILPFRKEADEWLNLWLKKDRTPFDEGDHPAGGSGKSNGSRLPCRRTR